MFVLLIDTTDYPGPPEVHGPFLTVGEAKDYAEKFRAMNDLPVEATPENNEAWTEAGWYFGIVEPYRFAPTIRLRITVALVDEPSIHAFTDAFNEWARHPDIDALMSRTTDTPTGGAEPSYSFEIERGEAS